VHTTARSDRGPTRPVDIGTADELRDVNERLLLAGLKAQEQVELEIRLRAEAEAALAMRDEFISIAAHELRTPVTAIKASAQLALRKLEEATPDNERIVRYQLGILKAVNRLVLLINDLMDVTRMRSGALQLHVTDRPGGAREHRCVAAHGGWRRAPSCDRRRTGRVSGGGG
jgi:signal transduction histidine kinase